MYFCVMLLARNYIFTVIYLFYCAIQQNWYRVSKKSGLIFKASYLQKFSL